MAFLDHVVDWVEINVSNSVGQGGTNYHDDILVVQALLNYVCKGRAYFANYPMPKVDGQMSPETIACIKRFQQFIRYRLKNKVSIDGRIDRATGIRNAFGKDGSWTIRQLNCEAMVVWLLNDRGSANWMIDFVSRYPKAGQYLTQIPVGTLNLTLEGGPLPGSSLHNGTLDLTLE